METGLIVPVPEVEPAVGSHRAELDRSAAWAVPAHVTVLYPFLPPERIDGTVLAALRDILAETPGFTVTFRRIAWFGETVVWLAPEPDRPFRDLTAALWQRFPEAAPYGGEFTDVVPHLTIGHDAGRQRLEQAAEAVRPHLPITATITGIRLVVGEFERVAWRTLDEFQLGCG
jgi:2'-5' RNA ligase